MRVYECGKLGANDQPRRSIGAAVQANALEFFVPARGGIQITAKRTQFCPFPLRRIISLDGLR